MGKMANGVSGLNWAKKSASASSIGADRGSLANLIANSDLAIFWSTDKEGRITSMASPSLASFGLSEEKVIGKRLVSVFEDERQDSDLAPQRSLSLKLGARSKISNHIVRLALSSEDEPNSWFQLSARARFEGDALLGYIGFAVEVTQLIVDRTQKLLEEKFDQVTGFYNAAYFSKRFDMLHKGLQHAQRACALMILDVDHLHLVSEKYGTAVAEEVLAELAGRLSSILDQRGEVGRTSGHQFRIVLADMDDRGELGELAERVCKILAEPYRIDRRRIHLYVSIGIAVAPYDAVSVDQLVDAASLVLLSIKQDANCTYGLFTSELAEEALRQERLRQELDCAVSRGELDLVYTPLVASDGHEIKALRAELRWNSPEFGLVLPDMLWPMIESSPAVSAVGEWMLRQACLDAAQWPEPLRLAIAPPQRFLIEPKFRDHLRDALQSSALSASRIEIEIDELFLSRGDQGSQRIIEDLSAAGVRRVVSGFGQGNSSITLLADLGFDRVDISSTFIRNWASEPDRANAILSAIVGLARTLGVATSVRDVDALDVFAATVSCGVDLVEGPIFAAPIDQENVLNRGSDIFRQFKPQGPPRQRAERITLLRKIGLVHDDHYYDVLMKNISKTGAKIIGIAGVPVGTEVVLDLGGGQLAVAKVVNSDEKSQGVQFEVPLVDDGHGGLMTRHRISPYALAEAGLPLAALGSDIDALKAWKEGKKNPPSFVQLQLTHL